MMKIWCWLLLTLVCASARAGFEPTLLTDLHHDIWTSKEGAPIDISAMAQTTDGWIWLATPNGLVQFDGVRFTRFQPRQGEALLDARLSTLYAAPNGDLWIGYGGGGGVTVLRRGRLTHHTRALPAIGPLSGAQQDHDGSVWLATGDALLHFARGAWQKIGPAAGLPAGVVTHVFADQYGRVWVLSSNRVFVRNRPGSPFMRPFPDEENGPFATAPDGTAWRETGGGMQVLDKPPGRAVLPARASGGAANSAPFLFDRAGNFWTRNDDFTLRFMRAAELAGKTAFRRDAVPRETLTVEQQKHGRPVAFMEDSEGNVWLASTDGLERYRPQRVHCLTMDQKYSNFYLANDGPNAFWVVARPYGDLWRVDRHTLAQIPGDFDGTHYRASQAQPGKAERVADTVIGITQRPPRAYGKADGIDIGQLAITDARHDVATMSAAGMAIKVGPRFYPVRTDPPDLLANARAMTASANGDRWVNTNGGLVRILAADWQAWTAQPERVLATTLFDASDGYPGAQGAPASLMATTDNGKRVWFVGKLGLAWIDSTTIARNIIAPRVEVVKLHAGPTAYFGDQLARLPAGTRNIGIDYTALSFAMPERVRFRYRLIGQDDAWQDGGTRRTVDYTNLGPGDYQFQVIAANEDGVWGKVPAVMPFLIAPLVTQTWWFFTLCGLAGLGALALLHRARVRSVRKNFADRMHERLHERERIARALHDTYLQSVQGLVYVFHDVAQRLPAADGSQPVLHRALAMADDVLLQGREQVMGLRTQAQAIVTLDQSFTEIGEALAHHHLMVCTIGSSGAPRALRGHVQEELVAIGREALLNAFRHSRGTSVALALRYDARKLVLSVEDDGIGLPEPMLAHGNRAGHWGLPGMRERAENIDGALAIGNVPGGGLRIVLTVPGRTAYARQARPWSTLTRWWPRR